MGPLRQQFGLRRKLLAIQKSCEDPHPGTGLALGLPIAEAVARRHDGWLGLHSLPFWQSVTLQLPAAP